MAHLTVEMTDHAKQQLRAAMTHAVELAEQETEERMREKAIDVFKKMCPFKDQRCKPDCKRCSKVNIFTKKLDAK